MRIKFNKFEKVAGLFVLCAIAGMILAAVGVAVKKGWFQRRIPLETIFASADGIHVGTVVVMAGLRAGNVDDVELLTDNTILVRFEISENFYKRVRSDSIAKVSRPFIISEKVIEVTVGGESADRITPRTRLKSEESTDIIDLMSGRKLAPYLNTITALAENLKTLAEAFTDSKRTQSLVVAMDRMAPLLKNLDNMSVEMTKLSKQLTSKKNLYTTVAGLANMTRILNKHWPAIVTKTPIAAENLMILTENLTLLTTEMKQLLPVLNAIAPDLPRTSQRAIEAIDEVVITLKAMQKSFFLRSNVKEVKEEEEKTIRQPATESPP